MSIRFQILGRPETDNALLVQVDGGQGTDRLLFDCGDRCMDELSYGEIQAIDHLFFSHFHMDHVSGFDNFFRCVFNRTNKPNRIWGPPGAAAILQHRFQGFLWNWVDHMSSQWRVTEIHPDLLRHWRYETSEAYATAHAEPATAYDVACWDGGHYVVEAMAMDHRVPSMAYVVREKPRYNVDPANMAALGLTPGSWLKAVKEGMQQGELEINGQRHDLAVLRQQLLTAVPGESIAYLTDFLLDEQAIARLVPFLSDVRWMVCESQYRHVDAELAHRNFHMTTTWTAKLAAAAQVDELVLFHISNRYPKTEWPAMLAEARAIFPRTRFPEHWDIPG
ncbi:ribonuclease Z [Chitinivorax tropicus]|uniref:Ribonuclease Z n=1 Tax=Chitinivorax tropicus TaxID=714531 RepID=A0A840MSM0_9PROT|nr:MBL fold metallo-hydrolase [Chitinivorax tropicus]MBB5020079.1 ribonuclease Z [Chitinivorax tropicus]